MDDVAILLHHVDLLNARDVVHSQLFQVALQLLVIRGRLVHHLLLSPSRALRKSIKHDVMFPNMVLKSVVLNSNSNLSANSNLLALGQFGKFLLIYRHGDPSEEKEEHHGRR